MMITSTMSSLTSGAGSGLATQVLAPTKPELSVGPHSSEHHNLCCPTCSLSPEPTASSSIPATQLADSRMRTTEWFGYLVPHGKPPTTSTALLRAPFPLSDSTTAMAYDSTRHGYRRPTRSSSRTNLIYQSRSRTSTSSFLCHMAPSARASSSPSQHGNGEPNHCNHARATTMASDGKLAPKTHRQTASCREHMVTSWSLSYALCGLKRPTPHSLPLTAPSSTFTATKTSPLALPPATPGSPDMTLGPHGSTSTRKKARSRLHHLQPTAYNKPRSASKPTFTPHSRNRSMLSGAPGMKTRTWTLRTLAASSPASGSSRPTSPSYSGRTPNSNTGSPRRRKPIRPLTCRSNPSPSKSTPIKLSSPR